MNCLFLIAHGNILENNIICIQKVPNKTTVNTNHASVKPRSINTFRLPKLPLCTPLQNPLFRNLFVSPVYEMHSNQKHHN